MTKLLVLFDLAEGQDALGYENWARDQDTPAMLALPAIRSKQVFRMGHQHGSDRPSPFAYAELLDVEDLDAMGRQIKETPGAVALVERFREIADKLSFNVLEAVDDNTSGDRAVSTETNGGRSDRSGNVRLIEALYDAIDRDDHPAIHEIVDADISWEVLKNYPEGGDYLGAQAVFEGAGFFPTLYTKFDEWRTRREDYIDAGDQVVTLGRYQGRIIANGQRIDVPFAHTWTVRSGRIVRMRQFTDTAEFVAAMALPPLPSSDQPQLSTNQG